MLERLKLEYDPWSAHLGRRMLTTNGVNELKLPSLYLVF